LLTAIYYGKLTIVAVDIQILQLTQPKDVLDSVRQWVRKERQRANWTQADLARRSGVPAATISRLERTGLASTDALFRIVFALNRLEPWQDFLKGLLRLSAIPLSVEGEAPRPDVQRVRHRKETP